MLKFKLKSLIWSNKLKSSTFFFVSWYNFQFIFCYVMELVEFWFMEFVAIFMILFSFVWFRLVLFSSVQLVSFPFMFWIFLDNHFNLNFKCESKFEYQRKQFVISTNWRFLLTKPIFHWSFFCYFTIRCCSWFRELHLNKNQYDWCITWTNYSELLTSVIIANKKHEIWPDITIFFSECYELNLLVVRWTETGSEKRNSWKNYEHCYFGKKAVELNENKTQIMK